MVCMTPAESRARLRALAQRAAYEDEIRDVALPQSHTTAASRAFLAACDPAAVLELLDIAERAEAACAEMRAALEIVRSVWRRPDEGHTAYFERMAADFYQETGLVAPGKSQPLEMGNNEAERTAAWTAFFNKPWRAVEAALASGGSCLAARKSKP